MALLHHAQSTAQHPHHFSSWQRIALLLIIVLFLAACGGEETTPVVLQVATLPNDAQAPVFTDTPTRTPTLTPTLTHTPTYTPTVTPSLTPTLTYTPTYTPTLTTTPTFTPSPTATTALMTLTPVSHSNAPSVYVHQPAEFTTPEGWSCEDFPCEDDIEGFLQRIQVPNRYVVSHVGKFPGQPMQIAYGPDGRLYGTVLLHGTREGAVFVLNDDGSAEQVSERLITPIGLAFQPGTDVLYVSGRITLEAGGGLWRVLSDGTTESVIDTLPCCFSIIDNQPNGLVFGPDGYLYLGVGALSDHAEPPDPRVARFATLDPLEAAILRIQPHTGEVAVYAKGIRNPYDLTFDSTGQFYATDNGILEGPGDRLVQVDADGHYGWPYWRLRGCEECPFTDHTLTIGNDFVRFPDYTLPKGIVAYTGDQFPENLFDSLFVALWHNAPNAQRVVRIDPANVPQDPEKLQDYVPESFVTGLIRPVDVVIAPDGSLVIADFIYGHIWRVSYDPDALPAIVTVPPIETAPATSEIGTDGTETTATAPLFVTSTPSS